MAPLWSILQARRCALESWSSTPRGQGTRFTRLTTDRFPVGYLG